MYSQNEFKMDFIHFLFLKHRWARVKTVMLVRIADFFLAKFVLCLICGLEYGQMLWNIYNYIDDLLIFVHLRKRANGLVSHIQCI
jgi:hypothetical protein